MHRISKTLPSAQTEEARTYPSVDTDSKNGNIFQAHGCFFPNTMMARMIYVSICFIAFAKTECLDAGTARVYEWLLTQWWFRYDSFEPALSLSCFAVRISDANMCRKMNAVNFNSSFMDEC